MDALAQIAGVFAMPFYVYQVVEGRKGCPRCRSSFEELQSISAEPLRTCPDCGEEVERVPTAPNVGFSESGLDDRAKAAGFTKLKRIGSGEYERQY